MKTEFAWGRGTMKFEITFWMVLFSSISFFVSILMVGIKTLCVDLWTSLAVASAFNVAIWTFLSFIYMDEK